MPPSRCQLAALLLLALPPACREYYGLCQDDGCDEGSGGAGGQPTVGAADAGQSGDGAAGEGGAAGGGAGDCNEDEDCQDESVCNGSERCQTGVCSPGTVFECEHGLVCTEGAQASCLATSPWAFFFTQRALLGLPTAELGRRPLATLGEVEGRTIDPLWGGFDWPVFSPDGSHLLLVHLANASSEGLFEVSLGSGQPIFRSAPELPYPGLFGIPRFTRDGRSVLVTDRYSGAYRIDLATEKTLRVSDRWGDALGDFEPCGPDSWISSAAFSRFGRLTKDGVAEIALGLGSAQVSPDQRYVLWHANEERAVLVDCLDIEKRVDVGTSMAASWSPSARHFSLDDADWIFRLFAIDDAGGTVELWSASDAWSRYWSDDGAYLIVERDDGWSSLAVSSSEASSPQALALSGSPEILRIDATGMLAWVDAEDGLSRQLVLADHGGGAKVLLADQPPESRLYGDWTRDRAFLLRPVDDHEELVTLTFDETGHQERQLFTYQGDLDIDIASDGSGLVLTLRDQAAVLMYWLALPSEPEANVPEPLALEEGIYAVTFEPWP